MLNWHLQFFSVPDKFVLRDIKLHFAPVSTFRFSCLSLTVKKQCPSLSIFLQSSCQDKPSMLNVSSLSLLEFVSAYSWFICLFGLLYFVDLHWLLKWFCLPLSAKSRTLVTFRWMGSPTIPAAGDWWIFPHSALNFAVNVSMFYLYSIHTGGCSSFRHGEGFAMFFSELANLASA